MDRYKVMGKLISISNEKEIGHAEFSAGVILINFIGEENVNEYGEVIDQEIEERIDSVHSCLETAYGVSRGSFEFGNRMENLKTAVNDLATLVTLEGSITLIQEQESP